MKKYTSNKIANLSWICSILVVLIHAGTYAFNLPGQDTATVYGPNVTTFVQMLFCEGICRIAVPLFFIFSGYLFFQNFEFTRKCILDKFKRRIFSLLIPYLFWSLSTFLFFYVAQLIPFTAKYFSSRPVVGISFFETVDYIFFNSLNSPLWYLNNLMILTILTPLLYVLIKKVWWLILPIVCICGIFDIGFLSLRGTALCAFCVGSFLSIHSNKIKSFTEKLTMYKKPLTYVFTFIWISVLVLKSLYLCSLPPSVLQTGQYTIFLKVLSGINISVGIPTAWLLYDFFVEKKEVGKFRLGQYGMMIFVMHHPIISIVKKVLIIITGGGEWMSLVCYFASAIITILTVIIISMILKKYLNCFYKLISGGR